MKPFTNKLILLLTLSALLGACSSKSQEDTAAAEPDVTQTITVEEPTQPAQEPAKTEPKPVKPAASTKSGYPQETLINVKAWDKKLKFLKTHFEQTAEYDGVLVSKSQGTLFYDRDKHMLRLDTTDTDGKLEQSALTDKKQILILDGQGREITTLPWSEWQQGQPNQALFDFGNYTALLARHNAVLKEPYLLELTPKDGGEYTLSLTLSKEDYFPVVIKIVSDLMVTQATLTDIQKNTPLAFDTFRAGGLFQ